MIIPGVEGQFPEQEGNMSRALNFGSDAEIASAFQDNTIFRKTKNGYSVRCKKGLWAVDGNNKEVVEKEAMHYFIQYYMDGEYD